MCKNNICNDCKYLEKELEYYGTDCLPYNYYTFYCTNTRSNYRKPIEYYVEDGELIPCPKWCLMKNDNHRHCFDVVKEKALDIKPVDFKCVWDDIKVGEIYHLPPFNKQKRRQLKVTYSNTYCATFEVLNAGLNDTKYITVYHTDALAKLLVKPRDIKFFKDDLPF